MKKILFGTAALVAMLGVGAPETAAQRAVGVNLGVGPTIPGDGDVGVHVNAGLGFAPAALPFGVRLEGMWQRIPEGDDHQDFLGGTLNAEVGLPLAIIRPYVIGGFGVIRHEEYHGTHTHGAHTDYGFNVGVGTRIGLGGLNTYVEARYHRLLNGDDGHGHGGANSEAITFVPITLGVRF
jgi:hypothetical protein